MQLLLKCPFGAGNYLVETFTGFYPLPVVVKTNICIQRHGLYLPELKVMPVIVYLFVIFLIHNVSLLGLVSADLKMTSI